MGSSSLTRHRALVPCIGSFWTTRKVLVHLFFRHDAIFAFNRQQYHISITLTYMHWKKKKKLCDSLFSLFALLKWAGTEPTISQRSACTLE